VCAKVRQFTSALLFLLGTLVAGPASAWVEQNPKGLLSLIEVERDGHATVTHELLLEVRGGPLKTIELGTADADAEILPDATVTRAAGGIPIPLIVQRRNDGTLGLEVDLPKGLRSGTYLFKVRYRTDLAARERFRRRTSSVELGWVGPRLDAGVDGVRAIFRLPASDSAPRLPPVDRDDPDPGFGVMVSGVHRTPQGDEIELVRSHVARGEPVLWRVEASPSILDVVDASSPKSAAAPSVASTATTPAHAPARSWRWLLIAAGFGLLLAALLTLKARFQRLGNDAGRLVPRALLPVPVWCRALLGGGTLGAALVFGSELEEPLVAAGLALVAMAFAAARAPRVERTPRGPGRWLSLRDEDAFVAPKRPALGAWLDSGTLRGVSVLALLLGAVVALALGELTRSPLRALLVALGGAACMPVFFTGRASDAVRDRVSFSRRFMRELSRALRGRVRAKTVAWGRVPDGSHEPDELRVLIQPKDGLEGLVALETGLDAQRGLGGVVGVPFVIVRAKEGSPAQAALPRGVIWARGRKPDERVAILSPKLPTVGLTVALVDKLVGVLAGQPPSKRRMSSGNPAFTAKLGTVRSPAHAT
jgi:hypothetical protein